MWKTTGILPALTMAGIVLQSGIVAQVASSQQANPQTDRAAAEQSSDGIPVASAVVQSKCGTCHPADDKGRLTRISFRRTTPEGWERTVRRMVALHNVRLEPEEARDIVRDLASSHGLSPEEAQPAAFEMERRLIDHTYEADRETYTTCTRCHSMGRILSQRRTRSEWELVLAMHRGLYPAIDSQGFRRTTASQREPGPDGKPPDNRQPMDKAIAHLSTAFPLQTKSWSDWAATMRSPQLAGRWALSAHQPGLGQIYGEVTIAQPAPSGRQRGDAQVTTEINYIVARTGQRVTRRGQALIYTGFQWRGRSAQVTDGKDALREVMYVDRDWRRMHGRWFNGAYDELGMDVTLVRIGTDPILLEADRQMVRTGTDGQQLQLYGANLPISPGPTDFDFGHGVTVARIVSATAQLVTVEVNVARDAQAGIRDVHFAGASSLAALAVYERVDRIHITPQAGMARLGGGANLPKGLQQFEATAYANGPDGKPNTADDLRLGVVDVAWSLEEYLATYNDDDLKYVGTLDSATGLFTPNIEGPNPKRRWSANNFGDVWVFATYTPPKGRPEDKPVRARAHLLVTVPLYMRWEPMEYSR